MEYLGLWVSNNGVRPLSSKVEANKEIDVPTKVRDVRRFVRIVNYYREMWCKRAHTLAPLTKICSTKVNFKCTAVEKNSFIDMEEILGRDVLLSYTNFRRKFIIQTDARKMQLGVVMSQNGKPIDFLFTKINPRTNKLYDYIKRTVKYSGNPKIFLYNYFRTPYNSIYGPQESHI